MLRRVVASIQLPTSAQVWHSGRVAVAVAVPLALYFGLVNKVPASIAADYGEATTWAAVTGASSRRTSGLPASFGCSSRHLPHGCEPCHKPLLSAVVIVTLPVLGKASVVYTERTVGTAVGGLLGWALLTGSHNPAYLTILTTLLVALGQAFGEATAHSYGGRLAGVTAVLVRTALLSRAGRGAAAARIQYVLLLLESQ
jgi:hypothetical protein